MSEGLALAVVAGLAVWGWYWGAAARERVLTISREVCRDLELQQLDDTVALRRMRLSVTRGRVTVRRVYSFDFSTSGHDRWRAEVCLNNIELEWVRVEHPNGPILVDVAGHRPTA